MRTHNGVSPQSDPIKENVKIDRKSTRLNSSHLCISYAVFCLKKFDSMLSLVIAAVLLGCTGAVTRLRLIPTAPPFVSCWKAQMKEGLTRWWFLLFYLHRRDPRCPFPLFIRRPLTF